MPWTTPTLRQVRETVRGEITSSLGRASFVANSVLRVLADATAALTHLTLKYIDWLALQLLPDTAETEWLDRHGNIWLVNADGSTGRKLATYSVGTAAMTGVGGTIVPTGLLLEYGGSAGYETTEQIVLSFDESTPVPIKALDAGTAGNIPEGSSLSVSVEIPGLDSTADVIRLSGGTDEETDEELRARVLRRIRNPPMGGAEHDYEAWALAVPGVTRAWCEGNEMGIGTVTVRFMMDDLREDNDGFPIEEDIETVTNYIDEMRPVTVKDLFVVAPIKQFVEFEIEDLVVDTPEIRAEIEKSIDDMLFQFAAPGQTIFGAWKNAAVMNAAGVVSFTLLNMENDVMASPGHIAVLGDIHYTVSPPVEPPEPPGLPTS